jgi:gliding motility-associated-like protein
VNNGSGWAYLSDGEPYSGTHTDRLAISNATQGKDNYQYRCFIKGGTCPVYSSPAALTVLPLPIPSLEVNAASPQICSGDSIAITAGSDYQTFLWNNSSNNSTITVNQPGDYWVEVTDSNNCSGKGSITILSCENFYIPNAFTPNGDGINEMFKPVISGNIINYEFNIYSRWGQLVFQSTDLTKGWDGYANGFLQNSGIFVWNCSFRVEGQKQKIKRG